MGPPVARTLWLVVIAFCLVSTFTFKVRDSRGFVEVAGGRIRWRVLDLQSEGDRPLGDIERVDVQPQSIMVVFRDGEAVRFDIASYRRANLKRLSAALNAGPTGRVLEA